MSKMNIRDRRTQNRYFVDNVIMRGYGWILGPIGIATYNALCLHADLDDQNCWPGHDTIAGIIGASSGSVKRHLRLMKDFGLINWEHQERDDGGQASNMYYILDPPSPPNIDVYHYPNYMHRKQPAHKPTPRSQISRGGSITEIEGGGSEGSSPVDHSDRQTIPNMNNPHIEQSPTGDTPTGGSVTAANQEGELKNPLGEWTRVFQVDLSGEEDFTCPACEETISPHRLQKNKTRCPSCNAPYQVMVDGTQWGKPPKLAKKKSTRKLGTLFPDCPMPLADVPYLERDKTGLLAAYAANKGILFEAVKWAINQRIPYPVRIERALTAAKTQRQKLTERRTSEHKIKQQGTGDYSQATQVGHVP